MTESQTVDQFLGLYARGGHLWTMHVSQRVGARVAISAHRRGIRPATLTMANLILGIAASVSVALLFPSNPLLAAACGVLGWQLAYGFDCADGQLARFQGTTSPGGAVTDLLVDFIVQLSVVMAALSTTTSGISSEPLFVAYVVGGWLLGPFQSGISSELPTPDSYASSLRRVFGSIRDYGIHILLIAVAIASSVPIWVVLSAVSAVNFLGALRSLGLYFFRAWSEKE